MSDTSRCFTTEENLSDICLILCTKSKRLTEHEDAISIEPVYLPESVTSLTKVCLCIDRSSRARTQRTNPRRNRITSLVPNYAVMKINRYICTTVVFLQTFSRDHSPPSFHPFSIGEERILSSYRELPDRLLRLPRRHLFDSLQGTLAIYLSISAFLRFFPPHPEVCDFDRIQLPASSWLTPSLSRLNNQFQFHGNLF